MSVTHPYIYREKANFRVEKRKISTTARTTRYAYARLSWLLCDIRDCIYRVLPNTYMKATHLFAAASPWPMLFSWSATITISRKCSEPLMYVASVKPWPPRLVFLMRSLPARSTRFSLLRRTVSSPGVWASSDTEKMQ